MRRAVLAAVALMSAGPAMAADWRAMPIYGRDLGFVDADSVRREPSGRISFRARFLLADPNPSGDYEYDSHDLDAKGVCAWTGGPTTVTGKRRFTFQGKSATPEGWIVEESQAEATALTDALCRGQIGLRSFARPEDGQTEYRETHAQERLMAYVTPEAELTGTVVQGFEMNGIALCGSELGCTADAPREFCWLDAPINVPIPAGASPEQIRRDTAEFAFRGRIWRSPTGRGFGHVRAAGCLAEATGPARPATIPKQPEQPQRPDPGIGEAAIAAHKGLEEAMRGAGAVTAAQAGNSWKIDELKARPAGWQGACGSDLMFGGKSLEPYPTAINWNGVDAISVNGSRLEIRSSQWGGIDFHLPTLAEAEETRELLDRLAKGAVLGVSQQGRKVTVRLAVPSSKAGRITLQRASAADAVRLAGMIGALRAKPVHSVTRRGNAVSALLVRKVALTFENEAKAREMESAMRGLMRACGAPAQGRIQ